MIIYKVITILGSMSVRFAARLAHAGALSALIRLADKGRTHPGWAMGLGAGACAGATAAQLQAAALECFDIFAGSVPQASTRHSDAGSACRGCQMHVLGQK